MKLTLYSLLGLVLLTGCRHRPERCLADTRINDRPTRFAYDTGAGVSFVLVSRVKQLGLHVAKPPPATKPDPGKVMLGQTGLCRFEVGQESYRLTLSTLRLPWFWGGFVDIDGAIGWPDLKDRFIEIDAAHDAILGVNGPPADTNGWLILPVNRRTAVLALELPRPDGRTGVVQIDTGNPEGVSLAAERWQTWRATRPRARSKFSLVFMPGSGAGLRRTYRAAEFSLGPLTWTNVAVRRATSTETGCVAKGDVFEGSLGLAALRQFNLIVDQDTKWAYLRPRTDLTVPSQTAADRGVQASECRTNSTVQLRFRARECTDLAVEAFEAGRLEAGLSNVVRLLELEPDNAWALAARGEATFVLHGAEGQSSILERALGDLNRSLQLEPANAGTCFGRGNVRYRLQQWEDALKDYQQCCELGSPASNYARLYTWLIRARTGHQPEADAELAAHLGKRRKSDWPNQIGRFLLGQATEAEFLHPRDPGQQCEAWFYAGMKCQLCGDPATARDYFRKSMAVGKKECDAYIFAAAELKLLSAPSSAQK